MRYGHKIFDDRLNKYGGKRDPGQLLYYLSYPRYLISANTGFTDIQCREYIVELLGDILYQTKDYEAIDGIQKAKEWLKSDDRSIVYIANISIKKILGENSPDFYNVRPQELKIIQDRSISSEKILDEIGVEAFHIEVVSKYPEILDKIKNPQKYGIAFERLIKDIFKREGKKATITPYHDNGVDIIVDTIFDKSPLRFLIQCKLRKHGKKITKTELESFFYKVNGDENWTNHTKSIFVTNAKFSKPALEFANKNVYKFEIWDREEILERVNSVFARNSTFD